MAPRWENAIDAQMELSARLGSDAYMRASTIAFLDGFYNDRGEEERDHPDVMGTDRIKPLREAIRRDIADSLGPVDIHTTDGRSTKATIRTGRDLIGICDDLAAAAYNADTIHVDDDMMTIWEGMLDTFEAEPLMEADLLAESGFLYLPRPYVSRDRKGVKITTRAVMWHPFSYRVTPERMSEVLQIQLPPESADDLQVAFQQAPVPDDGHRYVQTMLRRVDADGEPYLEINGIMLSLWHSTQDPDGFDEEYEEVRRKAGHGSIPSGLYLGHIVPWPFRSNWGDATRNHEQMPDSIFAWQALWRLMQQKLAGRFAHRPDRATRHRLTKAKWTERHVTVITLRRVEPPPWYKPDPSGEGANYQYRFPVRRHWKWQWYPSLGMHRQIVVEAYVKGPPDKPLRDTKGRVFELVR